MSDKVTDKELKALEILKDTSREFPIYASKFAEKMWEDSSMHHTVKNTGNGATHGKAAWLVGGSYLSKLTKKGLVTKNYLDYKTIYYITFKGKQILNNKKS